MTHNLKQLNDVLNQEKGHVEHYHTKRTGRYLDFDSVSTVIYDAVITEHLIRLLVAYYGAYEPVIFHTSIVNATSESDAQCLHRDTPVHHLCPLTLLFDITNRTATTEMIPGSHRSEYLPTEDLTLQSHLLVRVTTTHNAFVFHPCMIHRGVKLINETYKLSVTFIAKPKTKNDHRWCAAHSSAFGIHHNDDGLSELFERKSYPLLAICKKLE